MFLCLLPCRGFCVLVVGVLWVFFGVCGLFGVFFLGVWGSILGGFCLFLGLFFGIMVLGAFLSI